MPNTKHAQVATDARQLAGARMAPPGTEEDRPLADVTVVNDPPLVEPVEPCPEIPPTKAEDWPKPRPLCDACGQPAPTSVDDYLKHFAKDGPKTITVPSGATFVVDRPPLEYLAATRRLHPVIAALVLEKGAGLLTGEAGIEPDDLLTFVDYCVSLAVVDPPVSFDEGVEGRIWVKQIPEGDKTAVLNAVEIEV